MPIDSLVAELAKTYEVFANGGPEQVESARRLLSERAAHPQYGAALILWAGRAPCLREKDFALSQLCRLCDNSKALSREAGVELVNGLAQLLRDGGLAPRQKNAAVKCLAAALSPPIESEGARRVRELQNYAAEVALAAPINSANGPLSDPRYVDFVLCLYCAVCNASCDLVASHRFHKHFAPRIIALYDAFFSPIITELNAYSPSQLSQPFVEERAALCLQSLLRYAKLIDSYLRSYCKYVRRPSGRFKHARLVAVVEDILALRSADAAGAVGSLGAALRAVFARAALAARPLHELLCRADDDNKAVAALFRAMAATMGGSLAALLRAQPRLGAFAADKHSSRLVSRFLAFFRGTLRFFYCFDVYAARRQSFIADILLPLLVAPVEELEELEESPAQFVAATVAFLRRRDADEEEEPRALAADCLVALCETIDGALPFAFHFLMDALFGLFGAVELQSEQANVAGDSVYSLKADATQKAESALLALTRLRSLVESRADFLSRIETFIERFGERFLSDGAQPIARTRFLFFAAAYKDALYRGAAERATTYRENLFAWLVDRLRSSDALSHAALALISQMLKQRQSRDCFDRHISALFDSVAETLPSTRSLVYARFAQKLVSRKLDALARDAARFRAVVAAAAARAGAELRTAQSDGYGVAGCCWRLLSNVATAALAKPFAAFLDERMAEFARSVARENCDWEENVFECLGALAKNGGAATIGVAALLASQRRDARKTFGLAYLNAVFAYQSAIDDQSLAAALEVARLMLGAGDDGAAAHGFVLLQLILQYAATRLPPNAFDAILALFAERFAAFLVERRAANFEKLVGVIASAALFAPAPTNAFLARTSLLERVLGETRANLSQFATVYDRKLLACFLCRVLDGALAAANAPLAAFALNVLVPLLKFEELRHFRAVLARGPARQSDFEPLAQRVDAEFEELRRALGLGELGAALSPGAALGVEEVLAAEPNAAFESARAVRGLVSPILEMDELRLLQSAVRPFVGAEGEASLCRGLDAVAAKHFRGVALRLEYATSVVKQKAQRVVREVFAYKRAHSVSA